jgi:hypothetical protein
LAIGAIWNNPYVVRERRSARAPKLAILAVASSYVAAPLGGLGALLLARAAQAPSSAFHVTAPPGHWLLGATPVQAFARGVGWAAIVAIWLLGSGVAPVYAAVRRSREIVSGQADLVTITELAPAEIVKGSLFSSLLWLGGAIAAALPLLALGLSLGGDSTWTVTMILLAATLIAGAFARGAIGFVGAEKYARKGAAIVFACAVSWIGIPLVVLILWVFTFWTGSDVVYGSLSRGASPGQVEAAVWCTLRSVGLAATLVMAAIAYAWALRSCEEGREPPLVAEVDASRFSIERGPSLWKMGRRTSSVSSSSPRPVRRPALPLTRKKRTSHEASRQPHL